MATPMTADQFLRALQKWGVRFVEAPGWRTRNRNAVGPWGPVQGMLLHHTGDDAPDDADQRVLTNGRSDLPGPLCHWGMRDDGTAVLIGWGRANHAGRGAANVHEALLTEHYGPYPPPPGPDTVDGNQLMYGQETMYSGGHVPTTAAYRATVRIFTAVCDFHGWSGKACIGHKEWTSRKPDPGHLDMAVFRRDVNDLLAAGPAVVPTPEPEPPKEIEMRIVQVSGGRTFVVNGPVSSAVPADLLPAWLKLAGQTSPDVVPSGLVAGTVDIRTFALIQQLAATAAGKNVDVDEVALAGQLAPLLAAALPAHIQGLSDTDLAAVATAVADENARRQAA